MAPARIFRNFGHGSGNFVHTIHITKLNQGIHRKVTMKKCFDDLFFYLATSLLNRRLTEMSLRTSQRGVIAMILNFPLLFGMINR